MGTQGHPTRFLSVALRLVPPGWLVAGTPGTAAHAHRVPCSLPAATFSLAHKELQGPVSVPGADGGSLP